MAQVKKVSNNVLSRLFDTPLAITESKLSEIISFIEARESGLHVDMSDVAANSESSTYSVIDGVAVIPVEGILAPKMDLLTRFSGGTSIDSLVFDFQEALDRPDVQSIVLAIDSPGGDASNIANIADMIYAARGDKPIVSVIDPSGYSGAYWIASAADKVYMSSSTSGAGSVGVVTAHRDVSGAETNKGVKTTEIYAGQYKRIASQYAPLSDAGKSELQSRVDYVHSIFIDAITTNRNMNVNAGMKSGALDGKTFIGQQAVDVGLADGIESLDTVINCLSLSPGVFLLFGTAGMSLSAKEILERGPAILNQKSALKPQGKTMSRRLFFKMSPKEQSDFVIKQKGLVID